MRTHIHRVLSEHHLTPQQWAVLFAASYYLPAPLEQFIVEAQLEADENFAIDELTKAYEECQEKGWICIADKNRIREFAVEPGSDDADYSKQGVVLTEAGHELKEVVAHALVDTVEID